MTTLPAVHPHGAALPAAAPRAAGMALAGVARQADLIMVLTLACAAVAALLVGRHYQPDLRLTLGVVALAVAAGAAAWLGWRGTRASCIVLTLCNASLVALHIQLSHGTVEFHFGIFVLLGLLLVYRDWRPILLAAAFFAVHHLMFDRLQALGFPVYCMARADLPLVILHATYVVVQTAIELFLAVQLRRAAVEAAELSAIVRQVDLGDRLCLATGGQPVGAPTALLLQGAIAKMAAALAQVRATAATVDHAASEIARGNEDLSRRTESQAASLQQTAASMEQFTGMVRQTAQHARQASELAEAASQVAGAGGQAVARVVERMGAIEASARKISEVTGVIDGIAFQTNLLALNAAVEAARAGEHGQGFAVVAGEVRTLARRAATSAKEIKQLIDDSADNVAAGTQLVDQAGATMQEVVASIRRVADIVGEITAASGEQAAGIEQAHRAISQMDDMTQQNAALVEQAASASAALHESTGRLGRVVEAFVLDSAPPRLA